MAKAFSLEDGNLQKQPITTSSKRMYSDIDCSFDRRPSGDIYKKTDIAAVRQAVRNLLMTNHGEVPFRPLYGGNLNSLLFSLSTEYNKRDIELLVKEAIDTYEPRAVVLNVTVDDTPDYNAMTVKVAFQVINTLETTTVDVTVARIR